MTGDPNPAGREPDPAIRFRGTERSLRRRRPSGASGFGAGFRRGFGISLALHALVVALFVADFLRPPAAEPPPRFFAARLDATMPLEPDPVPEELHPPEAKPVPRGEETLLEPMEAVEDPRLDAEPAPDGDPPGTIGVLSLDGTRTPPSARKRGIPGGTGTGEGEGTAAREEPPAPEPPPPPPVFVAAKRVEGRCPLPTYPPKEREKGIEGRVRVRLLVDVDGSVKEATIARSSGSEALDEAALAAVRRWRFAPATEGGTPVPSVVLQPLDFRIADGR